MQTQQSDLKQYTDRKSNLVSVILTFVVFLALGKYLFVNRDIFDSLRNLNFLYILELVLLYFFFILGLSYLNKILIQKLDPRISVIEIVSLQFMNNFLNKILPKGGVAYRALYLKNNYQFSFSYFLASFTGLVVVNLASEALISLGAIFLIYLKTGLYNVMVILGFLAIIFGTLFIMIFKPTITSNGNRLLSAVNRFVEGWKIITEDPKDLAILVVTSIIVLLIDALNMYVVFYALKTPIQYSVALLLSSVSQIMSYINITPDGIGVREGVYLYISSIVTLSEPQILFGSLVQRAVSLLASLLFGTFSYFILVNAREKHYQKND